MVIGIIQQGIFYILAFVAFGVQLWALIDCVRNKPVTFQRAFKRTKGFWLGITAVATAIGLISLPLGGAMISTLGILNVAAVVAAGVYLADVRPALADARRGGNRTRGPYGPW